MGSLYDVCKGFIDFFTIIFCIPSAFDIGILIVATTLTILIMIILGLVIGIDIKTIIGIKK